MTLRVVPGPGELRTCVPLLLHAADRVLPLSQVCRDTLQLHQGCRPGPSGTHAPACRWPLQSPPWLPMSLPGGTLIRGPGQVPVETHTGRQG